MLWTEVFHKIRNTEVIIHRTWQEITLKFYGSFEVTVSLEQDGYKVKTVLPT